MKRKTGVELEPLERDPCSFGSSPDVAFGHVVDEHQSPSGNAVIEQRHVIESVFSGQIDAGRNERFANATFIDCDIVTHFHERRASKVY